MKTNRLWIPLAMVLSPLLVQAGRGVHIRPPLRVDQDQSPISEPKKKNVSEVHAIVYNSWLRHLSPEYQAARAADPGALNVNAWDDVPESSWFNNRMGIRSLDFAEIEAGLNATGGSPRPGVWMVTKIGDEGYTPKIDILDPQGKKYVLKFDLPAALERNSAAERICTLIMHAAGFNVPHNSIVYFRREDLKLGEAAKYTNAIGKKEALTPAIFEAMMQKLKPLADGRYRGLASFYLSGSPVGCFVYSGRRKDDPNDLIPHELRRELRGFRVIASWINHVDVGDKNTLDVFIQSKEKQGYVRHYLLDFGSTMGSGDFINGPFRVGHEYIFDGPAIRKAFFRLGIWRRPWEVKAEIRYGEVGYFQAEIFEPNEWKPNYPNLAFEQMDESDGYWGAKIVTAFSDNTIGRTAQAGEYTRPEVTNYVTDVLKRRRDAIGRYWFGRVTPLEDFSLSRVGANYRLSYRDIAVERGYAPAANRTCGITIESPDGQIIKPVQYFPANGGFVEFPADVLTKASGATIRSDRFGRTPAVRVLLQMYGTGSTQPLPVEVILGTTGQSAQFEVLGWYHAPHR